MGKQVEVVDAVQTSLEAPVASFCLLEGRPAELVKRFLRGREQLLLGSDDIYSEGVVFFRCSDGSFAILLLEDTSNVKQSIKDAGITPNKK